MVINPEEQHQTIDQRSENATKTPTPPTTSTQQKPDKKVELSNFYQDPKYKFSIQYPSDWQYANLTKAWSHSEE